MPSFFCSLIKFIRLLHAFRLLSPIAVWCSMKANSNLLIHSNVDRYLDSFQLWFITNNNAAINIIVHYVREVG